MSRSLSSHRRSGPLGPRNLGWCRALLLYAGAHDEVHDCEVIRRGSDALEVKVTICAHAEVFRRFNAADVGMKMIYMGDQAVVEGFNPKIRFARRVRLGSTSACRSPRK